MSEAATSLFTLLFLIFLGAFAAVGVLWWVAMHFSKEH